MRFGGPTVALPHTACVVLSVRVCFWPQPFRPVSILLVNHPSHTWKYYHTLVGSSEGKWRAGGEREEIGKERDGQNSVGGGTVWRKERSHLYVYPVTRHCAQSHLHFTLSFIPTLSLSLSYCTCSKQKGSILTVHTHTRTQSNTHFLCLYTDRRVGCVRACVRVMSSRCLCTRLLTSALVFVSVGVEVFV